MVVTKNNLWIYDLGEVDVNYSQIYSVRLLVRKDGMLTTAIMCRNQLYCAAGKKRSTTPDTCALQHHHLFLSSSD